VTDQSLTLMLHSQCEGNNALSQAVS